LALAAVDLLADEARMAQKVIKNYKPRMKKDEYLKFLRSLAEEEIHGPFFGG
jgi:hypothetical protein